jgi:hypothetical protein
MSYLYGPPEVLTGFNLVASENVYNDAAAGSPTLYYDIYGRTAGGAGLSSPVSTQVADGGVNYTEWTITYPTTGMPLGPNTLSANVYAPLAVNPSKSITGVVNVVNHAVPTFYANGAVDYKLSQGPITAQEAAQAPSISAETSAAPGFGDTVVADSSLFGIKLDNDPEGPTAGLDIDSITAIGDPEITTTLSPLVDLPADDPADSPSFQFDVDVANPGSYYTMFELNYSDEQDLPGADAPGSEHAYFGVEAQVTDIGGGEDDVSLGIILPEPTSAALLMAGACSLLARRRCAARRFHDDAN